ncbi:bacterial transferase hexapeptide repeat protein, partial [Escherichia coli MS 84-1]
RVNPEFQDFFSSLLRPSCEVFHVVVSTEAHYRDPNFLHKYFLIFFSVCCFFTLFAAIAHKTVLFCILKDLHKANNAPKVISKSFIAEVSMSDVLRPYRDLFPQIGQRVMIDDSSVVIGDVRLADDVGIWPLVVIRGDVHYVQIGARTNIQDGSMLHVTHKSSYNPDGNPLTIGEDVTVGHKVMLHGCTIGNRVLVGMGSILLDGAIVEDDVMIGAGSLVPQNKRLESGYLYLGSPVKQIRPLSDEEKAGLRYSANNYVKWKDEYLDQGNQTQP